MKVVKNSEMKVALENEKLKRLLEKEKTTGRLLDSVLGLFGYEAKTVKEHSGRDSPYYTGPKDAILSLFCRRQISFLLHRAS